MTIKLQTKELKKSINHNQTLKIKEDISKLRNSIKICDTTLRDGNQGFGINLSIEDKVKIAKKLSDLGIQFLEGGWPGSSNIIDIEFFKRIKKEPIKSKVSAVGMTRKTGVESSCDQGLEILVNSDADYITLVGKSWKLHVNEILKTTLDENLRMISDSIEYIKSYNYEVTFDAEHYFDGYKEDPEYAIKTLQVAEKAGASDIVLCDTRGCSMPYEIYEMIKLTNDSIKIPLGIHAHNDRGLATANSLFALIAGASHFQGTINGIGERCGNANLFEFIGNLEFGLGIETNLNLEMLTSLSDYVYEISNLRKNHYLPFVGRHAFAHKAGIHGHAVLQIPNAYEHIDPSWVGNKRTILISSQAGLANIVSKAKEFGFQLNKDDPKTIEILKSIKNLEASGYNFESANASLNLIYAKILDEELEYFNLMNWRAYVIGESHNIFSESVVKLAMNKQTTMAAAEGNGPVNAFDIALKRALESCYPELSEVVLTGYRVREIDVEKGTAAAVQVFIEFKGKGENWSTVGVSTNILEASKEALIDGYLYFLYKQRKSDSSKIKNNGKRFFNQGKGLY